MRSLDFATVSGYLALAAFLALASPGVRAVRADEGATGVAVHEAGPSCEADASRQDAAQLAAALEQVRREAEKDAFGNQKLANGAVLLNGRGYNYGAPPAFDAAAVMREIESRR